MHEFKRENRYVVVKLKDIIQAGVLQEDRDAFNKLCDKVALHRIQSGRGLLECVVVEKDWPEYEPTWAAIRERVGGYKPIASGGENLPFPTDAVWEAGSFLQSVCHGASTAAGWWGELEQTGDLPYDVAEVRGDGRFGKALVAQKLCLIHSEVAEAMEGHRKNLADDKLPHRPMIEVELADAVIRIADLAGALGLDLGGAIAEKVEYNRNRPDHKPENRRGENGKKY